MLLRYAMMGVALAIGQKEVTRLIGRDFGEGHFHFCEFHFSSSLVGDVSFSLTLLSVQLRYS